MEDLAASFAKKIHKSCNYLITKLICYGSSCQSLIQSSFRGLLFHVNPFQLQLAYFVCISLVGYLALSASKPKTASPSPYYKQLDIFFTSVSATTESSMSTVEMEVFSNTQLIIISILILLGGEIFTSMLGLFAESYKFSSTHKEEDNTVFSLNFNDHDVGLSNPSTLVGQGQGQDHGEVQLGSVSNTGLENEKQETNNYNCDLEMHIPTTFSQSDDNVHYKSLKTLSYVVLGYILVVHTIGSSVVALYTSLVPSAHEVLKSKNLQVMLFSVFATVSTFANAGFVPTNENMVIFRKNSGLLLLLIPQVLLGNTLYAPCLRFLIWILEKITKRVELRYILRNSGKIGHCHLLSSLRSCLVAVTVFVFILVQLVLFCSLEWNSEAMDGMSSLEKLVAALFQVVNSRHSGESVVDLSLLSPAILVLFVFMMYLPPYTSFMPVKHAKELTEHQERNKQNTNLVHCVLFSQLAYLVIFIILVCLTEREKLKNDPLNFNVLNITIEVISAYGNVGFSSGYSCKRQLKPEKSCHDASYGLVGKWSDKGKVILILVMFFGRLKKFSMKAESAWKLA